MTLLKRSFSGMDKALIRPSASLIVAAPIPKDRIGNGSNYRILMMKRNAKSSFVHAHVYPGGIVDKADHFSLWTHLGHEDGHLLTSKICAIRETFEESGLLLTTPPLTTVNLDEWKQRIHQDASQFRVLCDTFHVRPAVERLIPFSNWITPITEKKRYNTLFFLTVLEAFGSRREQERALSSVVADGKETVLFEWLQPEEALEKHREGEIVMIPPQWYSLSLMKQVPDYRQLATEAGIGSFRTRSNQIIKILPQAQLWSDKEGYDRFLAYPGDEHYQSSEYTSKTGDRHRLYFKGRMEQFYLEKNIDVVNIIHPISSL
ncbi:Nucleoside diphosphate-linked moiety X motif 19, mitochondrial [Choanephora cucurbitarum]|uniref:Nucleoside diphosphate-linked moiety X motif 19, mitochondrial n=1 Tax=Choanephora cucurbitarum TaxID=101091 RepID=A0A1C7NJD6_9FUNG|nr:Nucleoside diphosphate-linked moiety X motif 19, mitochondrial [Choanephora cucurbitarum]